MSVFGFLEEFEINTLLIVLTVLVLVSAVAVIVTKHNSRLAFIQLQKFEKQRDQLNEEWGRLLLEESTWASPARVEREAKTRLKMLVPGPDMTVMVEP